MRRRSDRDAASTAFRNTERDCHRDVRTVQGDGAIGEETIDDGYRRRESRGWLPRPLDQPPALRRSPALRPPPAARPSFAKRGRSFEVRHRSAHRRRLPAVVHLASRIVGFHEPGRQRRRSETRRPQNRSTGAVERNVTEGTRFPPDSPEESSEPPSIRVTTVARPVVTTGLSGHPEQKIRKRVGVHTSNHHRSDRCLTDRTLEKVYVGRIATREWWQNYAR